MNQERSFEKLRLMFVIVNQSRHGDILKIFNAHEVGLTIITHGKGSASQEILEILGVSDKRKNIIFGVIKSANAEAVCRDLDTFFKSGKDNKGIAFSIDIASVIGTSIYKYLSNNRTIGA